MFFYRAFLCSLTGMLLLCVIGCGGKSGLEFKKARVNGMVTYKGEPLEMGKIRFIPDGEVVGGKVAGEVVFADIIDGQYSIPEIEGVTVGKNRVEIRSYRSTGRMLDASSEDGKKAEEYEQFLPLIYNAQSKLSVDIKEGENKRDFDLE